MIRDPASVGHVSLSDAGSSLQADDAVIGSYGTGNLQVQNAAQLSSNKVTLGDRTTGVGEVLIDGAGSTWTNTGEFYVGYGGQGKLTISNGGHVTGGGEAINPSFIGNSIGAQGEVLLTDLGSRWEINDPLYVGFFGDGFLKVQSGATLASSTSAIAFLNGSSGHAEVTGAGSAWTVSDALAVGGHPFIAGGAGELEISAGGSVSVATTATVWQTGAVQLDAGTLQATTINLSGGSLGGVGNIIGNLTNAGVLEPGNSPGTLKVQGDYTQPSAGLLNLEIGPAAFDLLQVSGNAKLGGTLHLSLLPGATPSAGTTYDLVTASKLTGTFNVLDLPDLGGDRSWRVTYGADRFSVSVVPEPETILMAAIGLAIVLGLRRWR
ncbi:MAG: PEP-CTERM sorting domain-containing protein [Pirellulales bacterium]|nr:PEP-CTERM sorting domain-containing protein [Pirellulales bacterium]